MSMKAVRMVSLLLCVGMLAGCANTAAKQEEEISPFIDIAVLDVVELEDEFVALADAPDAPVAIAPESSASEEAEGTEGTEKTEETVFDLPKPEASGVLVKQNSRAVIDYSNTGDGYVMVQYTAETTKRLKVQIKGPSTTYTYNLNKGEWTAFPLSDGDGNYQIQVYQNTTGNRYSLVLSVGQNVTLHDEFAPFIRPNQYVNYSADSVAVAKAAELTKDLTDPLEKVAVVYDYVIRNLTYDRIKAATVKSGYLPDLDAVLNARRGICFDYASLMTGMLRSQGVPCKLVIGYAGTAYHAWINVWVEGIGWVDNAIYFNGTAWQRMDPTFASTGRKSEAIMKYIGDGRNYTAKYLY